MYLTTPLTMRISLNKQFADVWCGVDTIALGKSSPSAKAGGVFFVNSDTGPAVNENPLGSKSYDYTVNNTYFC